MTRLLVLSAVSLAVLVPTSVAAASSPHFGPLAVLKPNLAARRVRRPYLDDLTGGPA